MRSIYLEFDIKFVKNLLDAPGLTKVIPVATQGFPKKFKGYPNRPNQALCWLQYKKKEVGRHPKKHNKSHSYLNIHKIYANS